MTREEGERRIEIDRSMEGARFFGNLKSFFFPFLFAQSISLAVAFALSLSVSHTHTFLSFSLSMAHPAEYDPYDGIVPNPNKKKNPLVLVGALVFFHLQCGKGGVSRRPRTSTSTSSSSFSSQPFLSPLLSLSFLLNLGTMATAGVLVAGLVAFRQVQ